MTEFLAPQEVGDMDWPSVLLSTLIETNPRRRRRTSTAYYDLPLTPKVGAQSTMIDDIEGH